MYTVKHYDDNNNDNNDNSNKIIMINEKYIYNCDSQRKKNLSNGLLIENKTSVYNYMLNLVRKSNFKF